MNELWGLSRLFILLFLACASIPSSAQPSLSLFDIDPSGFPNVRGKFIAVGPSGATLQGLSAADLELTENGRRRNILSITCPDPKPVQAISSVISIDVSESMWWHDQDLHLAKAGAIAWVQALSFNGSECAVTSFEHLAYLQQDFTTDRAKLRAAVNNLRIMGGGTNFDSGLLQEPSGSIPVALRGKKKRLVLLLTDGKGDGDERAIVNAASRGGITLYSVVIGRTAPQVLKNASARTGGRCFESVASKSEIERIIYTILFEAQGGDPCIIEWESGPDCTAERTVRLGIPGPGLEADASYTAPVDSPPRLLVSPAMVRFDPVTPGDYRDATVVLTALDGPVDVSAITSSNPSFQILSGGAPPGFMLGSGEQRTMQIRFTPADSGYTYAQFSIASDACSYTSLYASGGFQGILPAMPEAELEHPNGGERLVVGSDTEFRWKGIPAADPVRLYYSTDAGRSWELVAESASGLSYEWRVPDTPSESCLARIEVLPPDSVLVLPSAAWGLWFSDEGDRLVARVNEGIEIWDPIAGRLVKPLEIVSGRVLGLSPDGGRIMLENAWHTENGGRDVTYPTKIIDIESGSVQRIIDAVAQRGFPGLTLISRDWDVMVRIPQMEYSRGFADDVIDTIDIWDLNAEQLQHSIPTGRHLRWAGLSSDGALVAAHNGFDLGDSIFIWDARQGSFLRGITPNQGWIGFAAFVPNSSTIVSLHHWTSPGPPAKFMRDINLSDARTGALLKTFPVDEHRTAVPSNSTPLYLCISDDGTLLAASHRTNHRDSLNTVGDLVSIWNLTTGQLWKTLKIDTDVGPLAFSPDGSRLAIACADTALRIWYLNTAPMQHDTSDSFWAIVRPQATFSAIDMGKVLLGSSRDSLVKGYIRNTGTVPVHILGLAIDGDDKADFTLMSHDDLGQLAVGDSMEIELRFEPSQLGLRRARMEVRTGTGVLAGDIIGEGVAPNLVLRSPVVDFGKVPVGDSRDTTIAIVLENTGTSDIAITGIVQLGPDTRQFDVIRGGDPFTLIPGGAHEMELRFSAEAIGRTNGRLALNFDGVGSPIVVQLFGQGTGGVVRIADDSGAPGERRLIPLILEGPRQYISDAAATYFTAEIRYDARILAPHLSLVRGPLAYGKQTIVVSGAWNGISDTLFAIPFTVALGDTDRTAMEILRFSWSPDFETSSTAEVETADGVFQVTGICYEGGRRMIEQTGEVGLKPSYPNPVDRSATIEFEVIEQGNSRLFLTDMLGNQVMTLAEGEMKPGSYKVTADISALPAGVYFYTLETPTYRESRIMQIVR